MSGGDGKSVWDRRVSPTTAPSPVTNDLLSGTGQDHRGPDLRFLVELRGFESLTPRCERCCTGFIREHLATCNGSARSRCPPAEGPRAAATRAGDDTDSSTAAAVISSRHGWVPPATAHRCRRRGDPAVRPGNGANVMQCDGMSPISQAPPPEPARAARLAQSRTAVQRVAARHAPERT